MKRHLFLIAIILICNYTKAQVVPNVNLAEKDTDWKKNMSVFIEDFEDNRNNWYGTKPEVKFNISNGILTVTNGENEYYGLCSSREITEIDPIYDFLISIKLRIINDPIKQNNTGVIGVFGISYSYSTTPDWYPGISINNKVVDGNIKINNSWIIFNIAKKGNLISFYVDDKYLTTISNLNFASEKKIKTYGACSTRSINVDYIHIYKNYSSISEYNNTVEDNEFVKAKSDNNYDGFLKIYPESKYNNEILQLKEDYVYKLAINGFIKDCDNYLASFPSGKYVAEINLLKGERVSYNKAINGSLSEYNSYLLEYPDGSYSSEVTALKNKKLKEIERNKKITTNSNKALWKIGNKM